MFKIIIQLGKLVGKFVWVKDGIVVGTRDVWLILGVAVGSGVGMIVGKALGFILGDGLGDAVGTRVGIVVGLKVGIGVGFGFGEMVGNIVGAKVLVDIPVICTNNKMKVKVKCKYSRNYKILYTFYYLNIIYIYRTSSIIRIFYKAGC